MESKKNKIISFGSLNYDRVYSVNHIAKKGETINASSINTFYGGKGLNQAIALSKCKGKIYIAGIVGNDGDNLVHCAKENGIDTSLIYKASEQTGHAIIQVDDNGNNSIVVFGGCNSLIDKDYIEKVISNLNYGDLLVLQNEINNLNLIIELANKKGAIVSLNPSPFNSKILECNLNHVDILILNEVEGYCISGEKEPNNIIQYILSHYPKMKILLTLGSNGSIYADASNVVKQPAIKVNAIDTTGAGDTFSGFFLALVYQEGLDVKSAMFKSAVAASIAVSRKGASNSIPSLDEVEKYIKNNIY